MSPTLSRHIDHIGKDYQTLCRLCLKKTSLRIDIYQEEGLQREIPGKILNCLSLIVTKDDPLPKFVCITCTHKLDNFQDFRDMCRESENLLIKYVSTVEECNQKEQHNQAPSVSPLSPCMEAESKQEVDLGEFHSPPSHEPSPAFVNCSIKTEPQDVDPSYSPHEETTSDTVKSITSAAIKSEVAEEQMDVGDLDTLGKSISQDYLQTEAGTSGLGHQDSEHLGASDNSAQFCASVFEDSYDEAAEIVPGDVKESELKIEADEPVVEEERSPLKYSWMERNLPQDEEHIYLDEYLHIDGTPSLSNNTSEQTTIDPQCSEESSEGVFVRKDYPNSKFEIKEGSAFKFLADKDFFSCTECTKIFGRRDYLTIHMRLHTGKKPFTCSTCNKAFTRKGDLRRHSKIHTGEKPFLCSTCKKAFARNDDLKKHLTVHSRENTLFKCATCNQAFVRKDELKKHLTVHSRENTFKCSTSNEVFARKDDLQKHSESHSRERSFVCSVCNISFPDKEYLKIHSRIHIIQKRFECSTCQREFSKKSQLENHSKIHTGEKPFVCVTCNKAFAIRSNLYLHSKIHNCEKEFICSTCNKQFTRKDHLLKHSTVHTGEKIFICPTCNKAFARKEDLKKHLKIHTREKSFLCTKCNKTFARKDSLQYHQKHSH